MGKMVISSVVTPAASYNLIDLPTLKAELNIPTSDTAADAWLASKITTASSIIASYCNRVFVSETVQDIFYPDRDFQPLWSLGSFQPLQLSRWPVSAINSIVIQVDVDSADDITLTQGVDYILNSAPGQVIRLSELSGFPRNWYSLPITVQYVAGFTTIPGDLQQAVLDLVTGQFYRRGRDPAAKRWNQAGGIGEMELWVPNTPQGSLPPSIRELLDDKYRTPSIAS